MEIQDARRCKRGPWRTHSISSSLRWRPRNRMDAGAGQNVLTDFAGVSSGPFRGLSHEVQRGLLSFLRAVTAAPTPAPMTRPATTSLR